MKRTWVTLQLLDTIQGSGERSGRAVMLRVKDILAPFASPWPHFLLLGHIPNTVPFAEGLKLYGSVGVFLPCLSCPSQVSLPC